MTNLQQFLWTLTCMTALNQQVFPTFFRPTGQLSILFLSCGLGESLHTSVWVRFRLALFSAMLASKTLKKKNKYVRIYPKTQINKYLRIICLYQQKQSD